MIDPTLFDSLPLIADGSPGDALRRRHPCRGTPPEALNLENPDAVQRVHGDFAQAGARLLRTNTAHANALALAPYQLNERSEAINNSGTALARAACPSVGAVMGALAAPSPFADAGGSALRELDRVLGEQIVFLSDTGVDFFLLEHFPLSYLPLALETILLVRRLSDAPILVHLRPNEGGPDFGGASLRDAAAALVEGGADALGIGCGIAPERLPPLVETLLESGLPVAVLASLPSPGTPNATPHLPEMTPRAFADSLLPLAAAGAAILGGCCNVGPDHIRALATATAATAENREP